MQSIDGIAGEALEQPVGEHGVGTAAAFLGRLEDQVDGAAEIPVLGEIAGGREQHGGVAVMAAGMHAAGELRGMRQLGQLLQRKTVHVGAQADGALARLIAADHADDAGLADILGDLDAPFAQLVGDELGRAMFLEAELGMGVDVAADRRELGVVRAEPVVELRHDCRSPACGVLLQARLMPVPFAAPTNLIRPIAAKSFCKHGKTAMLQETDGRSEG